MRASADQLLYEVPTFASCGDLAQTVNGKLGSHTLGMSIHAVKKMARHGRASGGAFFGNTPPSVCMQDSFTANCRGLCRDPNAHHTHPDSSCPGNSDSLMQRLDLSSLVHGKYTKHPTEHFVNVAPLDSAHCPSSPELAVFVRYSRRWKGCARDCKRRRARWNPASAPKRGFSIDKRFVENTSSS